MATRAGSVPPAGIARISPRSRLIGLGSVYGKTLRDSRRAFVYATILLAGLVFILCLGIASDFSTQAGREQIAKVARDLASAAQGTSGKPVNVATIGGYISWKYGPVFLIIASLWSILALSGTLAGEAHDGSLDFVAATPHHRRRIAAEKVAAHVTVMAVVLAIMAFAAWLGAALFAKLPGDTIPPQAAVAYVVGLGLSALFFGALAFVLAQLFGRQAGAGIAGFVLLGGWIFNGYGALAPLLAALGDLTPWAWTDDHIPLAGQYNVGPLVPLAVVGLILLAAGVEVFARRDLGVVAAAIPMPRLPSLALGLHGPISRGFGERLPVALAWGLGIGVFGLAMAGMSKSLADQFAESPDVQTTLRNIFPTTDITSAAGFLQLMIELLFIVAGLAAATLVAGWASDETSGRLEMLLSSPLSRGRWALLSGLGGYGAVVTMTALAAAGIGIGALAGGLDPVAPAVAVVSLGLVAGAAAGVGFAVGGLIRASIAAEAVVLVVVVTYLVEFIAPALKMPDWVHQLALTSHLGQPMVGRWDMVGVVACLAVAACGLLLGAWGMGRRDVG